MADLSSSYSPASITDHFDRLGLREWDRLVETPIEEVSLYLHTHYLRQHIRPGWRVLEIGAGAGRFTQVLAELGARILVADLSPVQLDLNRQHAAQFGFTGAVETWQPMDICEMPALVSDSFDSVVAYGGPFSYVLDQRDQALQECRRVLKPGGLLLLSVMSLWGSAFRHLDGVLLHTPIEANQKITASGDLTLQTFPERGGNFMHLFRSAELRQWLSKHELTILNLAASNSLSTGWEELLTTIRNDEARWNELLRMELEACAEPGALDLGTHLIAVAQKPR
jgi:2-polyprenyl-3-methyl-5-hydroxy-6-metoxy-1,4-benzoquinol methylase